MTRTLASLKRFVDRSLHRQRRLIEVSVLSGQHEVDSLRTSDPETLRASLRPIYAHLPAHDAAVRFFAVEEEWLPFGILQARHAATLPGLGSAIGYLTGRRPTVISAETARRTQRPTVGASRGER